tara:strand:+ start:306 stop:581 length:276 start_codon:yes stop_codon:yes gene_type:complete
MSDEFYDSTRVAVDGRLVRIFAAKLPDGGNQRLPYYQDEDYISAICEHAKGGLTAAQSSELVGISPSEVSKIRRMYRERWLGFSGVSSAAV